MGSRMTTVTGKSRTDAEKERTDALHQAKFPALRSVGEAARHAAMPESPSGMVGQGQVQDIVREAVRAAIEGTHDAYRRRLGDEEFKRLQGGSGVVGGGGGKSEDEGGTRVLADGVSYRSSQGGLDDAEAVMAGQPRVEGPNVEGTESFRRIGSRVAVAIAGTPAEGTLMETPDKDERPIGVVTRANTRGTTPTPLAFVEQSEQDAKGLDVALEGKGIAGDDDEETERQMQEAAEDDGVDLAFRPSSKLDESLDAETGAERDEKQPGVLSRAASAVSNIITGNQSAGSKPGADTAEAGQGKEAPAPEFGCKKCGMEFGSQRGLDAHVRAKHPASVK